MTKRRAPKLPSTHELLLPTREMLVAILLVGYSWGPAGCGQPAVMDDAYAVPADAYVPGPDAPSDIDGDGVLSSADCNDSDPTVTSTATRACTSACGEGNETCSNGFWSACSAPTDCDCTMPGATRVAVCGNCGMQSQTCTGGRWTPGSACLNEGECAVAELQTSRTTRCGERQRLCGATCTWGEWTQTAPDMGECMRGAERFCTSGGMGTCDDTCHWTCE